MGSRPTRRRRGGGEPLKLTAATIGAVRHPNAAIARLPGEPEPAPTAAPMAEDGHRHVGVEVENPNDTPLHVWASLKHYDFDPNTHVLTLWLTEHTPEPPPGIMMISQHPRTPEQVVVGAHGSAIIDVAIPHIIRKRVSGAEGKGMQFVEQRIGQIDHVEMHVQYADTPIPRPDGADAARHHQLLMEHGDVVQERLSLNAAPTSR